MVPNTISSDMGAYGNTAAPVSAATDQSIHLESPDLYTNWTLSQPHQIALGDDGQHRQWAGQYRSVSHGQRRADACDAHRDVGGRHELAHMDAGNSGLSGNLSGLWIQVSLVSNSAISDRGSETFSIVSPGTSFYINDGSITGDQYSTAAGSNRNTGMSPSSPLPMLTTLLREYTLNSSDTIFIDNGSYNTFAPAVFSSLSTLGTGAGRRSTAPPTMAHPRPSRLWAIPTTASLT